jgi:hypothetical protein
LGAIQGKIERNFMLSWALTFSLPSLHYSVSEELQDRSVDRASSLRSVHNPVCIVLPLPRRLERLMEREERQSGGGCGSAEAARWKGKNIMSDSGLLVCFAALGRWLDNGFGVTEATGSKALRSLPLEASQIALVTVDSAHELASGVLQQS